jgi:hypothetical protein
MTRESKFKVGDWVAITDSDEVYTTFDSMFKSMNFKNRRYNYIDNVDIKLPFEVFEIKFFNNQFLYGIRNGDGHELLFSECSISSYNWKDYANGKSILPTNTEVAISERLEGLLKLSKDNQQWLHNQLLKLKKDIDTLKSNLN